jgi:hypothetical protein
VLPDTIVPVGRSSFVASADSRSTKAVVAAAGERGWILACAPIGIAAADLAVLLLGTFARARARLARALGCTDLGDDDIPGAAAEACRQTKDSQHQKSCTWRVPDVHHCGPEQATFPTSGTQRPTIADGRTSHGSRTAVEPLVLVGYCTV